MRKLCFDVAFGFLAFSLNIHQRVGEYLYVLETGRSAMDDLEEQLKAAGIPIYKVDPFNMHKSAQEAKLDFLSAKKKGTGFN